MATLRVEPPTITAGMCATWTIETDGQVADAWWVGTDNGAPIEARVPGWFSEFGWQDTYCYAQEDPAFSQQPFVFVRQVLLFDWQGNLIDTTNEVVFTVLPPLPVPQPPPLPAPPPPVSAPVPPGAGPYPPFQPPVTGIEPVDAILLDISDDLNEVLASLGGIATSITGGISSGIDALLPSALDVLAGANNALANFVAVLGNELTPTADLWGTMADVAAQQWPRAAGPLGEFVATILPAALSLFFEQLEMEHADIFDSVISSLLATPDLPPEFRSMLEAARPGSAPIAAVLLPILGGLLLWTIGPAIFAGQVQTVQQQSLKITPSSILPPAEVGALVRRGYLFDADAEDHFARAGYPEHLYKALHGLSARLIEVTELLDLRNRDEISADELAARLKASGFEDSSAQLIERLRFREVPPSDLIRFLVREVFDPGQRASLDLDADFPEDSLPVFERVGVRPDDARNYWAAHWDLPSPTQGYQMLHRGVIDEDELAGLLRAADYAPIWRPRLQAISYHPLTRVDVRRMHKVGVLTEDELVKAYRDIGYTVENAERLRDFTVALNSGEAKEAIEPWRAQLRGRVIAAYTDGLFDADELREALTGLLYTEEQIDAYLAESDFVRELEYGRTIIAGVKRKYVAGFIDEDTAALELSNAGYDETAIVRIVSSWQPDREYRDLTDAERADRDLTKAEILAAREDSIITDQDGRDMLADLGYDSREIETLLALSALKARRAEIKNEQESAHVLYVAGKIDRATASMRLDGIGVATSARDSLLTRWDAERQRKVGVLPLNTLKEMYQEKVLDLTRTQAELSLHAYTADQQRALIELWGK